MIYDVKTYRLANQLTQLQMAELLGLSKSAVSMIEIGKRTLPESASARLIGLQKRTDDNAAPSVMITQENFFTDLTDWHRKTSDDYIIMHCGDLEAEKHQINKSIKAWTDKFNEAGRELLHVQRSMSYLQQRNALDPYLYDSFMVKRMAAENQLKEVLKQKPELAIIRLEGIKKELEAAKKLLRKRNRFPVIDEVINFYKFDATPSELPPSASGNLAQPGSDDV